MHHGDVAAGDVAAVRRHTRGDDAIGSPARARGLPAIWRRYNRQEPAPHGAELPNLHFLRMAIDTQYFIAAVHRHSTAPASSHVHLEYERREVCYLITGPNGW